MQVNLVVELHLQLFHYIQHFLHSFRTLTEEGGHIGGDAWSSVFGQRTAAGVKDQTTSCWMDDLQLTTG